MANIAIYKFNDGTDTLPLFESSYTYSYTDESNGDGTITRTITSDTAPTSISFKDLEGLVSVSYINTESISNFSYLFQNCVNLTSVDLYNISSSQATDMKYMFAGCTGLMSIDLGGLNTGNVLDMSGMFMGCSNIFAIDIKGLNTSKVTSMNGMFQNCENLSSLDMTGMNVSALSNIGFMFAGCTNLMSVLFTGLNLNNSMTMTDIFKDCLVLNVVNMDNCNIDDINMMINYLPEREAGSNAKLKVNNNDISGINTTNLTAKNWNLASYEIFVRYVFDKSIYANLIPEFNSGFTGYVVIDEAVNGNMVTRAIGHENLKPSMIRFGNPNEDGSTSTPAKYQALKELLYIDSSNLSIGQLMFHGCTNLTRVCEINVTNKLTNMHGMFSGCQSLTSLDVSNWDTSNVNYMGYMFYGCIELTSLDVSNWNVSKVASMYSMFGYCKNAEIININGWNTAALTAMRTMFDNCRKLKTIVGLGDLNTSKVTDMYGLFSYCEQLPSLDLSNWDTSIVTSMNKMFKNCRSLVNISLTPSKFNTSKVTDMGGMFDGCWKLTTIDMSGFNTSNVTLMDYMFNDCRALTSLNLSSFNTSKVTNMKYMFNASDDSYMNLETITFGPNWSTANVTDMDCMFGDCYHLTNLDVSNWNTGKVTNMNCMFRNCRSLTSIDVSNWNTSNVTVMSNMFLYCAELTSLDLSNWVTSKVTTMANMFNGCYKLTSLSINHWNVSKVTDIEALVNDCYGLTSLDLSNWDTSSVVKMRYAFNATDGTFMNLQEIKLGPGWSKNNTTDMFCMFSDNGKLTKIEGLQYLNTSKVKDMGCMFARCKKIESLDISNFDMSSVTNARGMFTECYKVKELDVSNWNTSNVVDMDSMFWNCKSLTSIDVSNWNTSNLGVCSSMFDHCEGLTSLDLSNWRITDNTKIYNMIDYCTNLKTVNINNIKFTRKNMSSNTWADDVYLEKLYANDINTINLLLDTNDIKDRTEMSTGVLVVPSTVNIPSSTMIELVNKNWEVRNLVVQYTFDANTYEDVIPEFNAEFTSDKYVIRDEVNETSIGNFEWIVQGIDDVTGNFVTSDMTLTGERRTGHIPINGNTQYNVEFLDPGTIIYYYTSDKTYINGKSLMTTLDHFITPPNAKFIAMKTGMTWVGTDLEKASISSKTITRTIESVTGELPTRIRFGHRDAESAANDTYEAAHGNPDAANALLKVTELSTNELTNMNDMFRECTRVTEINTNKWNTSKVTEMRCTFEKCDNLSILDVSNWDTSKVTLMGWLFSGCLSLTSIDVSKWNTINTIQMQSMFGSCQSLTSIDVSNFNTSKVSSMNGMFYDCLSLTSLDVSKWNTSNVTNMNSMFYNCNNITALDVSNWNTSNATNMNSMFQNCLSLTSLDVSNWDTGKVTNMVGMFRRCEKVTSLDVSNWDTSKVTDMRSMIGLCKSLTSIDVSKWDTGNVINIDYLFDDCIQLTEVKGINNWNTNNVKTINGLFNDAIAIKRIDLSKWDTSSVVGSREYLFASREVNNPMALKTLDITNWTMLSTDEMATNIFFDSTHGTDLQYVKCGTTELANVIIPLLPDRTSKDAGVLLVNSVSGINTATLLAKNWNLMTVENATVVAEYKFNKALYDLVPTFNDEFIDYFVIDSYEDTEDYVINDYLQSGEIPPELLSLEEDEIETIATGDTYRVPAANIVTRKIISTGNLPTAMRFGQMENVYIDKAASLLSVSQLNTDNLINANYMFKRCKHVKRLDIPNLNMENVVSMVDFIYSCSNIEYVNVTGYNLSNVEDMTGVIAYNTKLTTIEGINTWVTSSKLVTAYNGFAGDRKLTSIDLSSWTVGNLRNVAELFSTCVSITSINLNGWDTTQVRNMDNMFLNCRALTSLDVSHFNTSNVYSMHGMFRNCINLTSLDVSNFNTSNVTNMSDMFNNCKSLTSLDVSNWSLNSVNTMSSMFLRCESLTSLDVSKWNTSNVKEIGSMFAYCRALTSLDVSKWNTSNMTSISCVFAGSENLTTVGNLSNWNISKCASLYALFSECQKLKSVPGIGTWNTSNIRNMNDMFQNCHDLTSVDVSNWDTRNATTMEDVFIGCSSLTTIDVSNWNTGKVSSMKCMFRGCYKLQSLDLSNWDTRYVIDMSSLCYGCFSLTSVGNLSNWNTSEAINMNLMFGECHNLTSIDVSNWDTRNVTNMYGMFWNCRSLESLDLSNFDTKLLSTTGAIAMIGQLVAAKTINLNNVSITQAQADILNDSRFFLYNNSLEKLYINKLETLATLIGYIVDRTGKTPGKLVTSIREVIPADIMAILNARNWQIVDIVAQYRFNPDRYENLLPEFNVEFTTDDYTIIDTEHDITLDNMYWEPGIIDSTGADAVDSAYTSAARSSYLPVRDSLTYDFNIDYCQVFWYNENKALVAASGLYGKNEGVSNGSKCYAPADAKYLRIYRGVGSTTDVSISARYIDRILESTTTNLPARIVFGLNADSADQTPREESLLEVLDLNCSNLYNATKTFAYCTRVKFIRSSWIGNHINNMYDMFAGCRNLVSLDLSNLNTANVGKLDFVFLGCGKLTTVGDISNWNTGNVWTMCSTFQDCTKLQSLDLSRWNTSNVIGMRRMFQNCRKLTTIGDVSNWDTSNVDTMEEMFSYCYALQSLNLSGWNNGKVTTMYGMFRGCNNLTTIGDVSNWDTGNVTTMNIMFVRCTKLNGLNVSNWDVSKVTNMYNMFGYCESLTSLDLSRWNVSNVTNLDGMFIRCYKLTTVGDLANWDVRKVKTVAWMFEHAESITNLNIANWQTDSLTHMNSAFTFTYKLQTLDLRKWNTANVIDANNMFTSAAFTTLDISNFDLSNATDISNMFAGNCGQIKYLKCNNVTTLNKIKGYLPSRTAADPGYIICKAGNISSLDKATFTSKYWNIVDVSTQLKTVARYRFNKTMCDLVPIFNDGYMGFIEDVSTTGDLVIRKIEHLAGVLPTKIKFGDSGAYENGGTPMSHSLYNVYELDTSNATNLTQLFRFCTNLETIECKMIAEKVQYMLGMFNCCYKLKAVDVTGIKTDKVTTLVTVFAGCHVLTAVDVSGWNTSKVTDMHQLFDACHAITEIKGLENWDTSNVTRMSNMFLYNQNVRVLNVNNWNTSKATNMSFMFGYCQQLTTLDLSNWDTRNVTSMESLFENCVNLTSVGDLGNWNTSKVTDMKTMFQHCDRLSSLNVSNWDVSNVTRLHYTFAYCQNLSVIDVSKWNTKNVKYLAGIFNTCRNLYHIDISKWDTSNVIDMNWVFGQCNTIRIDVSNWNTSNVISMQGMFANTCVDNGLDVSNFDTSKVWDMKYMFHNCWGLQSINVSNWDTRNVEDMTYMFQRCQSLKSLDVSNFDTSKLRVADKFICELESVETLNLNNVDFTNVNITEFFSNKLNTLNKLYVNKVETLDLVLPNLPDRSATTSGKLMTSIRDLIPEETVNELTAKNWIIYDIIVNYTFDANRYENLLPEFNIEFTEDDYTVIDDVRDHVLDIEFKDNIDWSYTQPTNSYYREGYKCTNLINCIPNILYILKSSINVMFFDENKNYISDAWNSEGDTYPKTIVSPSNAKYMTFGRSLTNNKEFDVKYKIVNRTIESVNGKLPTMIRFGVEGDGIDLDNPTERSMSLLSVLDMCTRNLTVGAYMFRKCKNLTKVNINHFIVPEFAKDIFAECNSIEKIDVSGWDTSNVTSLRGIFCHCYSLTEITGLENWNTANVQDMHGIFQADRELRTLNVSNWDTTNATNMKGIFNDCVNLTNLDLSGWNTDKVEEMNSMFSNCISLTTIGNIKKWNTSKVTNMAWMFNMCNNLETQDVSGWDTRNVTDMNNMFSNCYKMTKIDVSGWDVSKVTNMDYMFTNLKCDTLNLANFNWSSVTANFDGMFRTTNTTNPSLNRLNLPSYDMNTDLGTDFLVNQKNLKFVKCENKNNIIKITDHLPTRPANEPGKIYTKIALSEFTDIVISTLAAKNWSIVSVSEGLKVLAKYKFAKSIWGSILPVINRPDKELTNYFIEDEYLDTESINVKFVGVAEEQTTIPANEIVTRTIYSIEGDLSGTANAIRFGPSGSDPTEYEKKQCSSLLNIIELDLSYYEKLTGLIRYCTNVSSLNITKYPTVPLIRQGIESAFASAKSLTSLDVSNFDVRNVDSLQWTFYDMVAVTNITGLETWNTSNVLSTRNMFDRCFNLTSLDVSNFDTSKVTNMYCMFANCQKLTEIVGIENFITTNVQNMEGMFASCHSLTSLDVSNFDTSNVTSMAYMFQNCHVLTSLDVSNFNTGNVTSMDSMFEYCDIIQTLDVSNWNTSNVISMKSVFRHCRKLTSLDLSKWNTSKVTNMVSMFGDCHSLRLLDISNFDTSNVIKAIWMIGYLREATVINLNNIVIRDDCTLESFFTGTEKAERIYMNEIDTLDKLVQYLPDRSSTTTGRIIMPNKDQVSAETVALLAGKNWHLGNLIASYKFDSNIYEDYVPEIINKYETIYNINEYEVIDTNNSNGIITRNIENLCSDMPIVVRFGLQWTSNEDDFPKSNSLIEVMDMSTKDLETMMCMFSNCKNVRKISCDWNTSNVTNMYDAFYNCQSLESIDVSNFDTSNVTNMWSVFKRCYKLTSIDVSKWNTSNVTEFGGIFNGCKLLTSIDVSNWDTSKAIGMEGIFNNCQSLESLDVSNFDTRKVLDMRTFITCDNLTTLDISNIDISSAIYTTDIVYCVKLSSITVNDLNTANTIIPYLPDRTGKEPGTFVYYDLDPALLDTETLQAKNWNLSYEPIMAKYIFDSNVYENFLPITSSYPQSNYEVIDDVKADGRVVRTLKYRTNKRPTRILFGDSSITFTERGILSLLDVLYVDIKENITDMNNIFAKAENITRINTRNWDTSNVTTLYCAFYDCMSLKQLEVGHFKTDNVTDMTHTFYNNRVLESVDVTNWNTSNVTAMYGLFAGSPFKELDLSNWDFGKATNVNALFMCCGALETLNISNFNINPNLTIENMLAETNKLSLVNVNNCSADVINLLLSQSPDRTNKDSIKFYALNNTKEHALLDKTTADAKNLKVVIRGGNIKAIHLPDELFQSLGLGNNTRVKHVHIGERFL